MGVFFINGNFDDYMCIVEKNDFIYFFYLNINVCINNEKVY